MIDQGRVEVNGRGRVRGQGPPRRPRAATSSASTVADPRRPAATAYIVLNKPRGVVSTLYDPRGPSRRSPTRSWSGASHALLKERLFHVGRLDTDTEGLIILTNDGDFGHKLAHPASRSTRPISSRSRASSTPWTMQRLRDGISPPRRRPRTPARAQGRWLDGGRQATPCGSTLHEGRNHIVRRTMEHVGHPFRQLSRIGIGSVRLGTLKVGQIRDLTSEELGALLDLVDDGS